MSWLGWCWAIVIGIFVVGVIVVFSTGPTQSGNREEVGCAIAGLGAILMFAMLFVTIAVDPGY